MTATILDGARVAADIRRETAEAVAQLASHGAVPGLWVIVAGEDPASQVYVRNKEKNAREAGLRAETLRFPSTVTEAALLAEIGRLNADPQVDAILVQLPLPGGIGTTRLLEAVDPAKDVDGFHPLNVGRLVQGKPAPVPCTPAGIMELLKRESVVLRGTRAVVLGRSDIVGKPLATLLTKADATVTVAHSKTRDLPDICREADLLVAAIGRPAFVTADFIREGAVVVDVGINRIDTAEEVARCFTGDEAKASAFAAKGSLLIGDVHPMDVKLRASRYTPVPGGVGPLTIARLLANTVDLCRARRGL
ncbi:MAG: bifunctional 5,10-methylenetetrahydrofolate dehydrogenase/5,10-methenyltetrahydrofolate cyclohydrolase [Deltaproteobacteria bacterium]|nr:bifunctional 5,10-methylenetetrahydrofolate dehydrogenase/5,10-methenyltetrahydrofolate cyclohydrolase [Deltaproteobacteria bacterium]